MARRRRRRKLRARAGIAALIRVARTGQFAMAVTRAEHEPAGARFACRSLVFDDGLVPCKGEHHLLRIIVNDAVHP
jgi:hypothetical protein